MQFYQILIKLIIFTRLIYDGLKVEPIMLIVIILSQRSFKRIFANSVAIVVIKFPVSPGALKSLSSVASLFSANVSSV